MMRRAGRDTRRGRVKPEAAAAARESRRDGPAAAGSLSWQAASFELAGPARQHCCTGIPLKKPMVRVMLKPFTSGSGCDSHTVEEANGVCNAKTVYSSLPEPETGCDSSAPTGVTVVAPGGRCSPAGPGRHRPARSSGDRPEGGECFPSHSVSGFRTAVRDGNPFPDAVLPQRQPSPPLGRLATATSE